MAGTINATTSDLRLTGAYKLLSSGQITVLSLDIFDTLLWRKVPEPADAFVLLGQRLERQDRLQSNISPQMFARLRRLAEVKARERLPGKDQEVSLGEIYAELPAHTVNHSGIDYLIEEEVDTEDSLLVPDLDILDLALSAAHRYGMDIILTSDTYFSQEHIRRFLNKEALTDLPIRHIFVSNEHRTGKTWNLFNVALKHLQIRPRQMMHIGDNHWADLLGPRKHGIRAFHFPKCADSLTPILERERLVKSNRDDKPLDPEQGDFGFTSLRAKVLNRPETKAISDEAELFWRTGASIFGPAFTGFGEWVQQQALEENVTNVYCLMREGQFLSTIINQTGHYLEPPVTATPVWASREVCMRAAIFTGSREEILPFFSRRQPPALRQLCDSLGIEPECFSSLPVEPATVLHDVKLIDQILEKLTRDSGLRQTIVENSCRIRERFLAHLLEEIKPNAAGRAIIVDLGWGGTIQSYLQQIFEREGVPIRLRGLYFMTNAGIFDRMFSGLEIDGFLSHGGLPEDDVRWILRCPEVLEQICMPNAGSLIGFDSANQPILSNVFHNQREIQEREAVRQGILAFQREWVRYCQYSPQSGFSLRKEVQPLLLRMLSRFVLRPTKDEAKLFGAWSHDENFGSDKAETIAVEELAAALRYMAPAQLAQLPMTRLYWPFGLAAQHDHNMAHAAAAIAEDMLPEEVFQPADSDIFEVFADADAGFSEAHKAAVSVRPNHLGLIFGEVSVAATGIKAVRIDPAKRPGVFRIDWIRFTLSVDGRTEPLEISLDRPSDFAQLQFVNCQPLTRNLILSTNDDPIIIYLFEPSLRGRINMARAQMAFAWISVDLPPGFSLRASRFSARLSHRVSLLVRRVLPAFLRPAARVVRNRMLSWLQRPRYWRR